MCEFLVSVDKTVSDPTPLLLAIDTSTEQTGMALYDGSCLDDVSWSSCRDHTVLLLDEIDHQLKRSRVTVKDLGAIAIATGPGRFNALRVGMSVAKGLALCLDRPLIGISTLEAIAYPCRHDRQSVAAVIDAGRGRLSWQVFDGETAQHLAETRNTSVDEFLSSIAEIASEVCVTGELNPTLTTRLRDKPGVRVPPVSARLGRAAAIAELAWERLQRGDVDDLSSLEPIYLHGHRSRKSG